MNAQLQADQPIDPAIVHRASEWMARMWSGEPSEEDLAACAAWRAAHPDHERAWNRLQTFEDKLVAIPRAAARRVLLESQPTLVSRRDALRLLGAVVVFGGMAYTVRRTESWKLATSDYVASTGDIHNIALPDGTQVTLDTASAIDVRYTGEERRVVLRAGRIYIATAADPMPTHRPFLVECQQGTVRALGTRFALQQNNDVAQVAVYQGAVEIRPRHAAMSAFRLNARQRTVFSDVLVQPALSAQQTDIAWTQGNLVAERMRVADLVAELSRYRRGILRCDDSAADLRVTGVFPLRDTDKALDDLMVGMPVEVLYRTRYWTIVRAR